MGRTDNVKPMEVENPESALNKSKRSKSRRIGFGNILISGIGFFADAYDLFVIDFVKSIQEATAYVPPSHFELGIVTSATLAGSVIGQLAFGFLGDYIGRRAMFITTAALCIFGNISSALVGFGYRSRRLVLSVFNQLAIIRFILGIGIGGEYPLSATVTCESKDDDDFEDFEPASGCLFFLEQKPNCVAAVFSMQGVGMIISPLMIMALIKLGMDLEQIWRFCLGIGAVPSAVAFYYRYRMHESDTFKTSKKNLSLATAKTDASATVSPYSTKAGSSSSEDNTTVASTAGETTSASGNKNKGTRGSLGKHLKHSWSTLRQFKLALVGTSLTWFLIDVTFYGTGSFKSEVVADIFGTKRSKAAVRELSPLDLENEGVYRPIHFSPSPLQLQRDSLRWLIDRYELPASPSSSSSDFPSFDKNGTMVVDIQHQGGDGVAADYSFLQRRPVGVVHTVFRYLQEKTMGVRERLFKEAIMGTAVAGLAIPGYVFATLLMHKTGLYPLTLWGFFAVAVAFFVLGGVQFAKKSLPAVDLVLFGLTFFFTNFGPNATTFILPTTVYPTIVRSTCHGFSAAMGKVGAVVGTQLFTPIHHAFGMAWLQMFCAAVAVSGAVATYLFLPNDLKARAAVRQYNFELRERAAKQLGLREAAVGLASAAVAVNES